MSLPIAASRTAKRRLQRGCPHLCPALLEWRVRGYQVLGQAQLRQVEALLCLLLLQVAHLATKVR